MLEDTNNSPDLTMAASATIGGASKNGEAIPAKAKETSPATKKEEASAPGATTFPPPKTDKPRPHVCGTCSRSFARLEHLKRHERSHTKEKPFECPQCTRCFARRDLLLRHQQKLHQAGATSTRQRGRRESTSGNSGANTGRVRKNSTAGNVNHGGGPGSGGTGMRPRANTISHIDGPALSGILAGAPNSAMSRSQGIGLGHSHHPSLTGLPGPGGFDYRGLSNSLGQHQALPKLDTQLSAGVAGGLRTAPISTFNGQFDVDKSFLSSSTINPAHLHFPSSLPDPNSPFQSYPPLAGGSVEDEDMLDWSLDSQMLFHNFNEQAVDESSPSASNASQNGFGEVMLDGSNQALHNNTAMWQGGPISTSSMMNPAQFAVDTMGAVFPSDFVQSLPMLSPEELQDVARPTDFYVSSPQTVTPVSPAVGMPGISQPYTNHTATVTSDSTSVASPSLNGSARQSSVTSVSSDSITEATRQTLIITLSQAAAASPLSSTGGKSAAQQIANLPSTNDLQRYVNSYIQYFHPHWPFIHVPTLSFDSTSRGGSKQQAQAFEQDNVSGGGGCLMLAMAAIGALYEFEYAVGKELFEAAKKIIFYSLDERRRTNQLGRSMSPDVATQDGPLWLIQAMLLNLIFGHNCGDPQAIQSATTLCASLVSLAKQAGLHQRDQFKLEDVSSIRSGAANVYGDMNVYDNSPSQQHPNNRIPRDVAEEHALWIKWKDYEERKRTFFAVFNLSNILVTAYSHEPRILGAEIRLDLPCDENLWAADNAHSWSKLGGIAVAQQNSVSFASAMSYLLDAQQREQSSRETHSSYSQLSNLSLESNVESELRPSTYGCYILISALHVHIWESRQRILSRPWKLKETEMMHARIEPALRAWQAAWRTNPHHKVERPNPQGPLSADCIPLLDIAYVRLFADLGPTKDAFWNRDFDAMAEELARGQEIVPMSNSSTDTSDSITSYQGHKVPTFSPRPLTPPADIDVDVDAPGEVDSSLVETEKLQQTSKRERHLRKAAFFAANSLSMADKLGNTFAEFTSRELGIGAAICTFDCAQVVAEWFASVQERVGRDLGIIGRSDINFTTVPAIMLLEEEDLKLLNKIHELLRNAEMKISFDLSRSGSTANAHVPNFGQHGFGGKILRVAAFMLGKAAVWPITGVMAQALEAHAAHTDRRVEASAPWAQPPS